MAFNKQELALFEAALEVIKDRQRLETDWCNIVDRNNALQADIVNEKNKNYCCDPRASLNDFEKFWEDKGFSVELCKNEYGSIAGIWIRRWVQIEGNEDRAIWPEAEDKP